MMKETSGIAMDVDVDGTSNNIDMEPSQTQANENSSKKVQLAELPKEMLEEILIHLDDENMLNASHVCKLFASVAETAFARKYSKKAYNIDYSMNIKNSTKSFDKVMLNKYGGKMRMIGIEYCEDEEILALVEQKCVNVKGLSLLSVSRIVRLKDLKKLCLVALSDLNEAAVAEIININPQLETLTLVHVYVDLLAIDGLDNLTSLHINVGDATDCTRQIQAINCNQIKHLGLIKLGKSDEDDDDDLVIEICKFKALTSLDLSFHQFTSDSVTKLVNNLPHLTELVVGIADGDSEAVAKILSTTSMLPNLTKLEIVLNANDFDRFSNELKSSANGFYARFDKSKTEIKLTHSCNKICISADYLFLYKERSVELHLMNNLNENNVRKLLNSVYYYATEFKFVNYCADRTLDIAALAHEHTNCLDIKSNGPIEAKSNDSRYHSWFPHLKILKIHLERHAANDFLRNLHANFCAQIEELWLNTKDDTEDPNMPNVLAKFGNLKLLYLGPSPIKFDLGHLFSVCRNLTEIKLTRVLCLNEEQ